MSEDSKKQVVDAGTELIDVLLKLCVALFYGVGYICGTLYMAFLGGVQKGMVEQHSQEEEK